MVPPRMAGRAAALAACLGAIGCRGSSPGGGVAAAALGSRPTAPAGESGAARAPAASYLQDDYERIFPERVRLARYGEVRYAAGDRGDAAGDGSRSDRVDMSDAPSLVVVDEVGQRVRVIAPQDHYRLLLWLDADDLYHVVTEGIGLSPDGAVAGASGAAAGAAAAIHAHPGMPVEVDGERGSMAHIRHRDDCVSFSGWAPRAAIGTQFVPLEVEVPDGSGVVGAGAVVYDRPGGREVARFLADCEVTDTGPESAGQRPIRYATEGFELRGWVAASSGKGATGSAGASSAWGYGLGGLGLWGARARLRLGEGSCLYARRGGPAIGVVTDDADAPQSPPVNGWWQVPLETGWGDLDVWVAEDRTRTAARNRGEGARGRADQPSAPSVDDEDEVGDGLGGLEADRPALRRCR